VGGTQSSEGPLRVNLGSLDMPAEGLFTAGEQTFRPDHRPLI
jgi:hypothetical protein